MIMAMRITEAVPHPHADALRLYRLCVDGQHERQVIANLENLYEVGDIVAVAQVGAALADGTVIRKARLRGIDSYGMILGRSEEAEGTDLTAHYGLQPKEEAPKETGLQESPAPSLFPAWAKHLKWPSIEHLHHIVNTVHKEAWLQGEQPPTLDYRAKIKLDGTNASVQLFSDGTVLPQSRSRLIHVGEDNLGFAAWVAQETDFFSALAKQLGAERPPEEPITLYGEWCGKGIQKRTAISMIPSRIFAIFAMVWGDHEMEAVRVEVEPERIRALLPEHPSILVLPWQSPPISLPFGEKDALEKAASAINQMIEEVEACDPWVREVFGIEGLGEGVVMYPLFSEEMEAWRSRWHRLLFKAKGEKHQVIRQAKPAQIAPERIEEIAAFVDSVLTPARLEQGLREACAEDPDPKGIPAFLRWIADDIQKEHRLEMESNAMTWESIAKPITRKALQWFRELPPTIPPAEKAE
jgi:tRNA-binding EMAP/Myf-like protein